MHIFDSKHCNKAYLVGHIVDAPYLLCEKLLSQFTSISSRVNVPQEKNEPEDIMPVFVEPHIVEGDDGLLHWDMPENIIGNALTTHRKKTLQKNAVIFAFFDCGIGYGYEKEENEVFAAINEMLRRQESFLYVVHCNSDNPAWFDNKNNIWSNIAFIRGCAVVASQDYNFLCVSGGIKFNRSWYESRHIPCERMFAEINFNDIEQFLQKDRIDCVLTSAAPTFIQPQMSSLQCFRPWKNADPALREDVRKERHQMDVLYTTLTNGNTIKEWAFVGYNNNNKQRENDILFTSVIGSNFTDVSNFSNNQNIDFELPL